MEEPEILKARERGDLLEAVVTPAESANGWLLLFTDRGGEQVGYTRHHDRAPVFHDLDHATALAKELGFEQVRVEERF
jgi:hypothetical protein